MNKKDYVPFERVLIKALQKVLKGRRKVLGCLCGHFESCENCNPSSKYNQLCDDIELIVTNAKIYLKEGKL